MNFCYCNKKQKFAYMKDDLTERYNLNKNLEQILEALNIDFIYESEALTSTGQIII